MLKKLSQILLVFLLLLGVVYPTQAVEEKKNIYFFWGRSCPHCAREKVFLQSLAEKDKRFILLQQFLYQLLENNDSSETIEFLRNALPIIIKAITEPKEEKK